MLGSFRNIDYASVFELTFFHSYFDLAFSVDNIIQLFMILVLMFRVSGNGAHHNNNAFVALIPVYTALIPIFIASRRRRSACENEKKNG